MAKPKFSIYMNEIYPFLSDRGGYEFRYIQYDRLIKVTDMLKDFTIQQLKEEIARRETEARKAAEREALLKELNWKNVLCVRGTGQWDAARWCRVAGVLGYKYFIADSYPHVYKVINCDVWEELKTVSSLDIK